MAAGATGDALGSAPILEQTAHDDPGLATGPSTTANPSLAAGASCASGPPATAGHARAAGPSCAAAGPADIAAPCCRLRALATAAEWEAYRLIRRDVFLESGEPGFQRADEDEDRLPDHFPLLLWHGDQPIGAIRIDLLDGGRAALRLVAIHPTCQARGHGAHLLREAEAFARRSGCRNAVVYATLEAAGFYARAGYLEEPWDDCCIGGIVQMTKTL